MKKLRESFSNEIISRLDSADNAAFCNEIISLLVRSRKKKKNGLNELISEMNVFSVSVSCKCKAFSKC